MTRDEYNSWIVAHCIAFPSIDSWLNGYDADNSPSVVSRDDIEAVWMNTLASTELADAVRVSQHMSRNEHMRPRSFDDTASYVAGLARGYARERRVITEANQARSERMALEAKPPSTWQPPELYRDDAGEWCYTGTTAAVDAAQYGVARDGKNLVAISDKGEWQVRYFGRYKTFADWPHLFRHVFENAIGIGESPYQWSPDA